MKCPFCEKTVTANPEMYEGKVEVKIYKCIACDFSWLPFSEEKKIYLYREHQKKLVSEVSL